MRDGTLVRAKVRARLLGVKLLSIDAHVMLTPAEVREDPLQARRRPSGELRPIGGGLARATRAIDEGAASLTAARNGASDA